MIEKGPRLGVLGQRMEAAPEMAIGNDHSAGGLSGCAVAPRHTPGHRKERRSARRNNTSLLQKLPVRAYLNPCGKQLSSRASRRADIRALLG
jgi:hypothetical protein